MRRNIVGTVLVTLLVVGALGALGYGLWQAGFQQGLVENGAEVVVTTPGPGAHAGWYGWHGGWGWGFFGIFKILFVFLFIGLIARFFFGPRRWGWGPYRGGPWNTGGAPMDGHLSEWHRRAHEGDPPIPPADDR